MAILAFSLLGLSPYGAESQSGLSPFAVESLFGGESIRGSGSGFESSLY
jgi:hypothetical protein